MTDHIAANDQQALGIARTIVNNLNWRRQHPNPFLAAAAAAASLPVPPGNMGQSKLPSPPQFKAPLFAEEEMGAIIPADSRKPFDIRKIIARIADGSEFHEFKSQYGTTIVTGFMHLYGMQVGVIANNGILYSESALKVQHHSFFWATS